MSADETASKSQGSNPAILIAALLIFGLVLGGFGMYRYNMGRESGSWPVVQGKITYARPEPRRVKSRTQYHPGVRYTYTVNGRSYTGNRITASEIYQKSRSGAEDILRKYPVGGQIPVHYNPADPGVSLLETGLPKNVLVLLGGAAACLFFAGAITVSVLKKRGSSRP